MANTVFANKVIEAKLKDLLTTSINTRSLMTVDESLTQEPGMTKTINVYTYTGEVEDLGVGEGNTTIGSISHISNDYTVKVAQQYFTYQDEDFMKDETIVDNSLKGANQLMVNKMAADFAAECGKATLSHSAAAFGYEAVVDAIAKLNIEDESKLFVVIPTEWKAELRKDEDYKTARMGEVVYNGQVGTVCGIPVIATNAVEEAYVMTTEAVSEMETTISEDGMIVYKDGDAVLTANNVGVEAVNLHAKTYLIIGTNSRFEDYNNGARTGCFWIGG